MQSFDRLGQFGTNGAPKARWQKTPLNKHQASAASSSIPSWNAQLHQLPLQRQQLIFRIRRQIAENTYDTEEKLQLALQRLVDSLGLEGHPKSPS